MDFLQKYVQLQKKVRTCTYSETSTELFTGILADCDAFLGGLQKEELISKVPGKAYFAFRTERKSSRAINKGLYQEGLVGWEKLKVCMSGNDLSAIPEQELEKILYSVAISFCAAVDLVKDRDQQTPGTFFNYFIAYLLCWRLGVTPTSSIKIMTVEGEQEVRLQTDLIYDLGVKKAKFHVPIKTSSRERAIMLWAHQKLLDGAYGLERYMGTPVLLAETKTDTKTREVTEICLPEQWKVYQLYISRLKRIYYLDLPNPYCRLQQEFPPIMVKSFAGFFTEWQDLMPL